MVGSLTVKYSLRGLLFWPENGAQPDLLVLDGFQLELALLGTFSEIRIHLDKMGWNILTATLTAKGVNEEDLAKIDEVVERVCWLLSFAGGALIAVNIKEIDGRDSLPHKYIKASPTLRNRSSLPSICANRELRANGYNPRTTPTCWLKANIVYAR
jgi:hypothetical protein